MSPAWWLLGLALAGGLGLFAGIRYMTAMPGESYAGARVALGDAETAARERLERDIRVLATDIGERNMHRYDALLRAAAFIEDSLSGLGFETHEQSYVVDARPVRNLVAEFEGSDLAREIVLFGAHYDTVPGSPGANDNASGVAALLELARHASGRRYRRTLRFVAFVNEEAPYFHSPSMGSRIYAREAVGRGENIVAMFSLETIGYYSEQPDSQGYPFPMGLLYPRVGNFIGFVANLSSRRLVRDSIALFRRHAEIASEGVAAPAFLPGIDWSDHRSFSEQGYPAVMVTDTALYRYAHYHLPSDTPEIIDFDRMALVVAGLRGVLDGLARPAPR